MLITLRKRVTRLENHIDTLIEKFIFHHKFLGIFPNSWRNFSGSSRTSWNWCWSPCVRRKRRRRPL